MLLQVLSCVVNPMIFALDPYVSWVRDFLLSPKTQRYVVKAFFALLVVGSLIFLATLAYAAFYWVYVPKIAHRASVYLQYQDDLSAAKGTARREPPTGVVDVTGANEPFLAAGQEYDVSVELVMPTSERNVQHGNFMVGVRLLDEKGNAVTNSSRPAILLYDSLLVRTMKTMWRAIPLTLGFSKEAQELSVSLLEGFVESAGSRVTRAEVSVSSPDLQVYSIQLLFDAHFRGLRYLMYYHRITTALIFISSFLFWETIFALLGWKVFVRWWQTKSVPAQPARKPSAATANAPVRRTHITMIAVNGEAPEERLSARRAEFPAARKSPTATTMSSASTAPPNVLETPSSSDEDAMSELVRRGQRQDSSEDSETRGVRKRLNHGSLESESSS